MTRKDLNDLLALRDRRERQAAQTLATAHDEERAARTADLTAGQAEIRFGVERRQEEVKLTTILAKGPQVIGQLMATGERLQALAERHKDLRRTQALTEAQVQNAGATVVSARAIHQTAVRKAEVSKHLAAAMQKSEDFRSEISEELENDDFAPGVWGRLRR